MKCFRKYRDLSLNWKICLVTSAIILFAILVSSVTVYNNVSGTYKDSLNKAVGLVVQKQSSAMASYFWRTEALSTSLENEIPNFFPELGDQWDYTDNYRTFLRMNKQYQDFCQIVFNGDLAYSCFLFLDSELPITRILSHPETITFPAEGALLERNYQLLGDRGVRDTVWYQNAQARDGDLYWFSLPGDDRHILAACSIRNMYLLDSRLVTYELGVLVVSFNLSKVDSDMKEDIFRGNLRFLITDGNHQPVFTDGNTSLGMEIFDQLAEQKQDGLADEYTVTLNGTRYRLWEESLPSDMLLYYLLPEKVYDNQVMEGMRLILTVFLTVLVVELCLVAFFSSLVSYPIKKLTAHMRSVSAPTPISHSYQGENEISVLYHTYNEMSEKQDRMIRQISEYAENQKAMQYKLLQAQINPHFIYNTLDSVGCAAMMNGDEKMPAVLNDLAALIRYNVYQPEKLVALSEEMEMLDKYIEIQQFRCDDHLRVTYEIPWEVTGASVPKTLLQPIVENGISYGSANPDGYRYLTIRATRVPPESGAYGDEIIIHICNESSSTVNSWSVNVEKLNAYLNGQVDLKRKSSGLGILNVQQRIRLVYGGRYGIHYEQMGDQTVAVIRLPFLPAAPRTRRAEPEPTAD